MSVALLVMSYGTPASLADVEAYYTHIRRGRPPTPELLAELVDRYRAVGGPTALNRITRRQADAIGRALADRGQPVEVHVGFKHVAPFIGDAVRAMADVGIERAVGLVLAPHYSLRSIAEYEAYAAEAAGPAGIEIEVVPSWHDDPGFVDCLARRLAPARAAAGPGAHVLFTAHSVPAAVVERGDPYPDELRRTCELVAEAVGVADWSFAYQSAGRTAEPWLGPDVLDAIDDLAERGVPAIAVQAIGFVADHLEVLYDLDVEARDRAAGHGLGYARAAMPNADADFVAALAGIVGPRLDRSATAAGERS